jgi:hypothetical protein
MLIAFDIHICHSFSHFFSTCLFKINENMRRDHPVSAVPALKEVTKHIRYPYPLSPRYNSNMTLYMRLYAVMILIEICDV